MLFPDSNADAPTQFSSPLTSQVSSQYASQMFQDESNFLAKVGTEFVTAIIRKAFVTKVYTTLAIQLLVVLACVLLFIFHEPTKNWIKENVYVLYIGLAVSLASIVLLALFREIRRKVPYNYLFLGLFTVAQGLTLGMMASCYASYAVLMAVGITLVISAALSLFALVTKWDFTLFAGFLLAFSVPVLILSIVWIFVRNQILDYVYAAVTCFMFSMYLVYDTQLMLIGKHRYTISPEEYVFAALNLYVDIVNIFSIILDLVKMKKH